MENGLLPNRLVGVPALSPELFGERIDRTIVVLGLAAFLVAAGFLGQAQPGSRAVVRRRDRGA